MIKHLLEDFRYAKNGILKGASFVASRHLPPPGKAYCKSCLIFLYLVKKFKLILFVLLST